MGGESDVTFTMPRYDAEQVPQRQDHDGPQRFRV
jgi:hypothetical protein